MIATGREAAIKRHTETLGDLLSNMSKLIRTVEAEKIAAKEDSEEIDAWLAEMERKVDQGDEKANDLAQWLADARETCKLTNIRRKSS